LSGGTHFALSNWLDNRLLPILCNIKKSLMAVGNAKDIIKRW
jgi:hypothetical protein